MSFYSGYSFFFCLLILLIPTAIIGMMGKKLLYCRYVISFMFIWAIYSKEPSQLIYFVCYVVLVVLLVRNYLIVRNKYGRNKYYYRLFLTVILAPLVLYKIFVAIDIPVFGFIGISYICFRVIQVIIEIYDGVIKELNIYQFIEYLIFFPCLSSGPIDRSRRFNEDDIKIWDKSEYLDLLFDGIYKIVLGAFYKIVCSSIIWDIIQGHFTNKMSLMHFVVYTYLYGFYLFFDFAGYSYMAVGTSYILGIRTPDNFNKPFLSVDIKDFWNRWHITLSTWFRDFVFTRFIISAAKGKWFDDRLTAASVGLIINMTIMGIWHGLSFDYIFYGIYHGIVLAIVEVYQKKSAFYKKYRNNRLYIVTSWFININVVMFGFGIFSGRVGNIIYDFVSK